MVTPDSRLRTKGKFGRAGDTFLYGKKKLADGTLIHGISFIVDVMLTSVAVRNSTNGMILVSMMVLKQRVQGLHQPEAEKDTQECTGGEALVRIYRCFEH